MPSNCSSHESLEHANIATKKSKREYDWFVSRRRRRSCASSHQNFHFFVPLILQIEKLCMVKDERAVTDGNS
jgi:hypothetical protein